MAPRTTKYGRKLPSVRTSGPTDDCYPRSGVRACASIYAGHGASPRSLRIDRRTSSGRCREVGFVRDLRATSSAHSCRLADVSWQRANEFCGPVGRSDDRKRARYLVYWSAAGLPPVLAAITTTRQGRSAIVVG